MSIISGILPANRACELREEIYIRIMPTLLGFTHQESLGHVWLLMMGSIHVSTTSTTYLKFAIWPILQELVVVVYMVKLLRRIHIVSRSKCNKCVFTYESHEKK